MPPTGEFELIGRYFARGRHGQDGVEIGIGDDAAIINGSGRIAVAVDTLVEGVHFPADCPPTAIGHRALAVNISDIAAMGLWPRWFTLALTLPAADEGWLEAFASGMFALADRFEMALIGGDTTRGPLTITIQAMADAGAGEALVRSGAHPGDAIFVSGTLGDAAGALACMNDTVPAFLRRRFEYPEPRVAAGQRLRGIATAALDISDGLLADLGHICHASGCGARVDVERLPMSPSLRDAFTTDVAYSMALSGGDDYELCFTVPPERLADIAAIAAATQTPLRQIGECIAGKSIQVMSAGKPYSYEAAGYRHF